MLAVLKIVQENKAKLVLVGDPAQLQPVGPGATFRALLESLGFAEIQTVYRQSEPWQRQATVNFSAGNMAEGLAAYQAAGCIHLTEKPDEAINNLCADWKALSQATTLDNILVISHRNEDVDALNRLLRETRVNAGVLSEGYRVKTPNGVLNIAPGDRILFLKNERSIDVFNGRFATVQWVDFRESGHVIQFKAKLDGVNDVVIIDPLQYASFTYGYAATVHKTQGMTVDHSLVYAGGKGWNRELTYVALSRHRTTCHLYADQKTHTDEQTLARHLSRLGRKDSVLDFLAAFAWRRGIETSALEKKPAPRYTPEQIITIQQTIKRREDAKVVADYVDAHQAVGIQWHALQAKLNTWGLSQIPYKDKASLNLVQGTVEYQAFQTAQRCRNQKADEILNAPERYERALAIYEIGRSKLTVHAQQHQYVQRVQRYLTQRKSGFAVYRDYAALQIMQDIKRHYPYLQEAGLTTKEPQQALRAHALAYLKRQRFLTLTAQEQLGFEWVEAYQKAAKAVGQYWAEHIKDAKQPESAVLMEFDQLRRTRDECAVRITHHPIECAQALAFYQIGNASAPFGEPPSEAQQRYAHARWDKVQQHAAAHERQARVVAYQNACDQPDLLQRLTLAYEIVQETKAHHGAILRLVGHETMPALWRQLRQDAKRFETWRFYRTLDAVDRLGFKSVYQYVDAKETCTSLWRSFFKLNQQAEHPEQTLTQQLAADAPLQHSIQQHTQIRDQLAAQLLENPTLYQAGITYFQIPPEELDKAAYQHRCRLQVVQYQAATSRLIRAEAAAVIMADPKAHARFVKESGLNWQTLRQDAKIAERRKQFAGLTTSEKARQRLVDRYRMANRAVGKGFARYQPQKTAPVKSCALPPQLKLALAKRDYFAWRLVNTFYSEDAELFNGLTIAHKLSADKLLQQHARFTEQLAVVERYQQVYQQAIAAIKRVYQQQERLESQAKSIPKAINQIHQAIHGNDRYAFHQFPAWRYALQVYALSDNTIEKQRQWLTQLKTTLQSYAVNQTFVLPAERTSSLSRFNQPATLTDTQIDGQRVRAALKDRAEHVATHYLGQPKSKHGNTWRYGSHQGSLVVTVNGAKQGLWHDFQLGKGGDMFGLIQHTLDTSNFKTVLQEAVRFLGGASFYQTAALTQSTPRTPARIEWDADTQQRIQKAQAIYRGTQSIIGTLAERYLREHRGILGALDEHTFRYHPNLRNWMTGSKHPAFVIAARDKHDNVCGIQAIFLDIKTAKKALSLGHHVKLSRGLIGEGALVQRGKPGATIALAEGPETALSVAEAQPDWTVIVTFGVGNFAKARLPENAKRIVMCADNDGQDSATQKSLAKSAEKLAQRGIDVWIATPQKPDTQAKWDFNDALLAGGIEPIKHDLAKATLYKKGVTKENLNETIEKTLSALKESTLAQQMTSSDPADVPIEIQNRSLKEILARYVDMELEQTRLVNAMHSARLKDPKAGKAAATAALAHARDIQTFAAHAMQHSDIQTRLETQLNIKPPHIADRGGFIGIRARLQQGEWVDADIQILVTKLRNQALSESRAQARERERNGGRRGR